MSQSINFPLSSPQTQAAERVQSQNQHAAGNLQHALAGEAEKHHEERAKAVSETSKTENPDVDQEGHQGQEYEASEREGESSPGPAPRKADSSESPDDDDTQGRIINVVV